MNLPAKLLNGPLRARLERDLLPQWLPQRRWFRSKARKITAVTVEAAIPLRAENSATVFSILQVTFAEGEPERYALPLVLLAPEAAAALPEAAVLTSVDTPEGQRTLCDACWDAGFRAALVAALSGEPGETEAKEVTEATKKGGTLRGKPASSGGLHADAGKTSKLLYAEHSNTAFICESKNSPATFVKLYRRLEAGVHPEPEMLRFLREHTGYRHVPGFLSSLEWIPPHGGKEEAFTAVLAQDFVAGQGDAWEYALRALGASGNPDTKDKLLSKELRDWASLLGRRTGELHTALGSRPDIADFAPEPLTEADLEAVRRGARALLADGLAALEKKLPDLPATTAALARTVLAARNRLETLLDQTGRGTDGETSNIKTRTHGDLHLGQILVTGDDVRILDFEGEPGRALAEARVKQSPLRDAAGMLRSFHYAAHAAARAKGAEDTEDAEVSESAQEHALMHAEAAAEGLHAAFVSGYDAALQGTALPTARDHRDLLALFVLEKAVYELHYELNNRPAWADIPLRGLAALCNTPGAPDARDMPGASG